MTTYLEKSCSFGFPRVLFVNCRQFMYYFPFGFEGRIWDLTVSVPDHCLSFYFTNTRDIQFSPYVTLCVSPYRVLNLTLGTKYKYTNEH